MGDATIFPYANTDPSDVRTAAPGAMGMSSAAAGGGKAAEVMAAGKEYTTKKGKGKDQYGRKAGKKQKAALYVASIMYGKLYFLLSELFITSSGWNLPRRFGFKTQRTLSATCCRWKLPSRRSCSFLRLNMERLN